MFFLTIYNILNTIFKTFILLCRTKYFLLSLIFLLGAFLRLYHLDLSPQHLNWDETALGYTSYSLIQTARDEYGRFLPLTLKSFNDYKGAIYAYLIAALIPIFGLNEITIRLPSAIAGSLLILVAY